MSVAQTLIPYDIGQIWEDLNETCGPMQRERLAADVDKALKLRNINPAARMEIAASIETGDVNRLPDEACYGAGLKTLREVLRATISTDPRFMALAVAAHEWLSH